MCAFQQMIIKEYLDMRERLVDGSEASFHAVQMPRKHFRVSRGAVLAKFSSCERGL